MDTQAQQSLQLSSNADACTRTCSPPKAKKISISILVISLPLLYVSLLHVPPSSLFTDTAFWFLISNSIIVFVAADSGMFSSSSPTQNTRTATNSLYDEYTKHIKATSSGSEHVAVPQHPAMIKNTEAKRASNVDEEQGMPTKNEWKCEEELKVIEPVMVNGRVIAASKQPKYDRSRSELPDNSRVADAATTKTKKSLVRSATATTAEKRSCGMEESEYWEMSDEELNKRVEEFISRFNSEIRLEQRMSAVY